jgi:anti-anti-sigma factor
MEFRKGILFVRLYGLLNNTTLDTFDKEVKEVIVESGIRYVVLNTYNLESVSSDGVKAIKRLKRMLKKVGGEFFLFGGEVKELKSLVNLENELKVFERVVI